MAQDPLQYLPIEKWSELQSVFKTDWFRGISGYVVLTTQKNLMEQGLDYGFKVYCPFGDVWNGMVALNEKDKFYEVIIQCPREDTEKLEDALRRTKVIDWDKSVIVPFASYQVIECLRKVVGDDFKIDLIPSQKFVWDKPETFTDVSVPPGISFGLLSPEHVDLVDSKWPHRYVTSSWYYELLISAKKGYGLFEDNKLITWVFVNESGILLHLYTEETHRKKGYAELLLKLVTNMIVESGKPAIAYCVETNWKSYQLFSKVGYDKTEKVAWTFVNKK